MSAPLTASTSAHVIAFVGATPTHQRSIERVMSHLIGRRNRPRRGQRAGSYSTHQPGQSFLRPTEMRSAFCLYKLTSLEMKR